jgi:flagellar protein FlaF
MNAHALALAAYGKPTNAHKTPRAIEYDLFAQITSRLRTAIAGGKLAFPALAAALTENRRLWTELALDLASDDNALPTALRAQLLGLAQFSLSHTESVLRGKDDAEVLVEINLAIMRGLKGQGGAA